jgi:protein SCO1/2
MTLTRVHLALFAACAATLAVLAAILIARVTEQSAAEQTNAAGFHGGLRPAGIPVFDFTLRDQDGHRISTRSLRGRPVIVTFIYAHCKDTCPITVQQIRGALDDLGQKVPVIAVSVDPKGDTPSAARGFLLRQHMTGRMEYLLGTRAQLKPVWRHFFVREQLPNEEHTASTVLLDARGRQRIGYFTSQLTPEDLAADVRRLERND